MTANSNQGIRKNITIRHDFQYGDLGKLLTLHGILYHQEYQFNHEFESYVAGGIAEFAKVYREGKSRLWIAEIRGEPIGTLTLMERTSEQAQFRWFLIHPDYRGMGLGKLLMEELINFGKEAGYQNIYLWTLDHLTAARFLYQKYGFEKVEEKNHTLWGQNLTELRYDLNLVK